MPGAPFLASFAKCAKWGFDASPEVTRYNFSIITLPHPAAAFPVYLHVGPYVIHPHFFFEALSYVVAFTVYLRLRRRFGDSLATPLRWALVAAAVAGGALGAKILFWLEDPQLTAHSLDNPAYLVGGKTIVGALVFGLISVELTKRYIGLGDSTGDLYAIPLALGIAIGRIGCFLTGLSDNTYGTPTHLPWAVNFGDGIPRHPTQLYEIFFLLALIPILYRVLSKTSRENVRNKTVILSEAAASRSEADAQSTNPASPDATTAVAGNPYSKVCHFEGARANQTVSREIRFRLPSSLLRSRETRVGGPATPSNSSSSPTYPSACSATSSSPIPASCSAWEEFSGPRSSSCFTIPPMSPAGFDHRVAFRLILKNRKPNSRLPTS